MSRDRLNSKADLENKKAIAHFKSILCVLCVSVVKNLNYTSMTETARD